MSVKIQSGKQYLRCTKRLNNKACPGCGKVYTEDVENYVYKEMVRKLREGQSPATYTKLNENPQVKQIYREIEEMEKVASNISLWGEIDFEEKRFTVDKMIRSLKVFPGSVQIQWKF